MKRVKTKYPGVFYREAKRVGGPGTERIYYIVFKKDGKVCEEKVGRQYADDMTEARAARIRAERIEGKRQSRKEIREKEKAVKDAEEAKWTIARLWEEYKVQHPLKGLAQDESRYNLYIKPAFEDREPSTLVQMDIARVRLGLLKSKKPQTVKNILALLRRIINFGVKEGLCAGTGFTIEVPKKINNLTTEKLTEEQIRNLLDALDRDHDIQAAHLMKMALFTGMRRGELFKLQWNHIDFEGGFITLVDPKGGIDQKIPMNESARALLVEHPRSDKSPFVFPGRNGNQRVEIRRAVNRIKKAAGLPKSFRPLHGLRHVYATVLASSGQATLYSIQKLLTHKSPQMTIRYADMVDKALRKASNVAGDILTSIQKQGENVVNISERENA